MSFLCFRFASAFLAGGGTAVVAYLEHAKLCFVKVSLFTADE